MIATTITPISNAFSVDDVEFTASSLKAVA
jgi:hypothetical protein